MLHNSVKKHVQAIMANRPPDFIIGPPENLYMLRWWLIPRNRFFNIYLHHILHDDDDRVLHDHPWASLSYVVAGKLVEMCQDPGESYSYTRTLKAGQWVRRSARFAHRLILVSDTATTIFMTGPVVREWGFHCPKGWVPWRDFVKPDKPGEVGRSCGEP